MHCARYAEPVSLAFQVDFPPVPRPLTLAASAAQAPMRHHASPKRLARSSLAGAPT